jgi:hypothetical protein
MVKIVWTDAEIEDLNAIGESLVELREPKLKKKKKLYAEISLLYFRGSINEQNESTSNNRKIGQSA